MICENLLQTQNSELSLNLNIRAINLDQPRSEQELKDDLLAHALDCHECLTVVLFGEASLADCGCPVYQELFQEATEELERQQPVDVKAHLDENSIEAFFFDRLSDEQLTGMADHVENCEGCRTRLQDRQAFYFCVKAAVQDQKEGRPEHQRLTGILGVSVPEAGLNLCSRINEMGR